MADKKTRGDLEILFSTGKIPTQSNFAELIASGVNQKDDGLQKANDSPLKIQAPVTTETDARTSKDLVLFYENIEKDDAAKWRMGIRAGSFEIGRGTQTDFLIDGNGSVGIGIGASDPKAKVHVFGGGSFGSENADGKSEVGDAPFVAHTKGVAFGIINGSGRQAFALNLKDDGGTKAARGIITFLDKYDGNWHESINLKNGMVGIGTAEINGVFDVLGKMHVKDNGTIEVPGSKNSFNGIIETFYSNSDRYGIGQFDQGVMAMYTSDAYAQSSIQFGIMTGASSFKSQVKIDHDGKVGIGTTDVKAKLHVVGGAIMPAEGNSESAGILFPPDVFGGSGDRAYIRYYARTEETAESTTLEIGNKNDADDNISLMPSGKVGIGTLTPSVMLEVKGRIKDQTGFVMPVGSIVAFGGSAAPDGWLICNGQSIAAETYAELRGVLGRSTVPDLRGRTLIAVADNHLLNQIGGAEMHVLAEAEMPHHNHHGFGEAYDDWTFGVVGPKGQKGSSGGRDTDNYFYNTSSTGGNGAHNNMQPYYVVNYIIKY